MYNRDSRIMRKLLGKSAPDSSAGDIAIASSSATINATYRPTKSQNAVHPVGVPIACLDVSPDRHNVVLGGPHILKTMVSDFLGDNFSFRFKEGVDIRAAITAQKSLGSNASLVADQLNIRDVKWNGSSTVLTACAAGRIFAYDIARLGTGGSDPLDYIQMQEDARQVNTLDINPHLQSWLLSGSQDGMVRVFDLSGSTQSRSGSLTFRQRYTPLKTNDAIRQVKWSPKQGYEMACCTDAGTILKWDVRQPSRPLLRINAHDKVCSSIAWHPDGTHLISAGWDTKLHVWDLGGKADKRQKPKYTISTPAPVTSVAWRPALWSATAQTRRLAQVAVTYDESSNKKYGASVVQIWDLARPSMPYKEIERFDNSPASLFWHDQDLLWTVGRDGIFNQCDVAFAPKVIDRQSTSAMAFSSRGDVVMFLDERPLAPRPQANVTRDPDVVPRTPFGSVPNTAMLSVSRSDSEEDVMPTFLGPRRRSLRRRRLSGRSGLSISTTPPSTHGAADDGKQVLGLEESINVTGMFKTQQGMASGHVPAAKSVHVYQYLSGVYLETLQRDLPSAEEGNNLIERVGIILEQFAKAAENVRLYRLSQTWRILAFSMSLLLEKRADYHLQIRIARSQRASLGESESAAAHKAGNLFTNLGPGEADHMSARPLVPEERESTSNIATPLARPADGAQNPNPNPNPEWEGHHFEAVKNKKLTPIPEPGNLSLGPPVHRNFASPRQRLDSAPISESSHDSENSKRSITEGYDFYDAETLSRAIDVPVARSEPYSSAGRQLEPSSANESLEPDSLRLTASDVRASEGSDTVPTSQSPDDTFISSQTTVTTDDGFNDTQASQRTFPSQTDFDIHDESAVELTKSDPPGITVIQPGGAKRGDPTPTPTPTPLLERDPSPHIIEHDYFPWKGDHSFPFPLHPTSSKTSVTVASPSTPVSPLNPYTLLARALEFESRTSALNASAMVLLLKPLVPESVIDTFQATAILRQHHSRLMGMGLFVEAALLRNLSVKGWPAGLPHWGENYTALFTCAQQGVKMGLFCASCNKPREVVDPAAGHAAIWTCHRCHRVAAPCAICGHREAEPPSLMPPEVLDAPVPDTWLTAWWYCPGCSHGGHASCLQAWHAPSRGGDAPVTGHTYSDGCCPLDGCGHACLPGRYRAESSAARAAADSARVRDEIRTPASRRPSPTRMPISGDVNEVPQSKAVGIAREALNTKGTGGILSSSPGRPTLPERERRKSVKFAKPER